MLSAEKEALLFEGTVIPAHPLVLTSGLRLDEEKQRRLTRYYIAAGAGGIAVGVHTTQFEIRDPEVNLLESVLRLAAEEVEKAKLQRPFLRIAGVCGPAAQAVSEARLAKKYGYDMALVSMAALDDRTEDEVLDHIRVIAEMIPVFGFYLQSAIGGRVFTYDFWTRFAAIPNVMGIKVAAFNRYQTLDVVRAVCNSPRHDKIALYTGNDDNIVADLLTSYRFSAAGGINIEKRFVGGLLGHWAVWTRRAVELLAEIKKCDPQNHARVHALLAKGIQVTDMNAAIFDPAHHFHGCITGVHEALRRQGLMDGIWTLNPREKLSPGQAEEIGRVCRDYPDLVDDAFVAEFLNKDEAAI